MKKGLSVLLVAAALFGFYGGAVNLNDILACKDYWEEAGEKSTADMNKLEDGLNQLKDNEQAYLDGLDQVAQGEKDLAQGEADYAAGQAQLAKGEADYAAAPGKLADARRQIAAGEEQLAEGKKSLDDLSTLIKGISDIRSNYQTWKKGYDALHQNRQKLVGGLDATADPETGATVKMALLGKIAPQLDDSTKTAFTNAVNSLDDTDQSAGGYKSFAQNAGTVAAVVDGLVSKLQNGKAAADQLKSLVENNPSAAAGMSDNIVAALNGTTEIPVPAQYQSILGEKVAVSTLCSMLNSENAQQKQLAAGLLSGALDNASKSYAESLPSLQALQAAYTNNLTKYAAAVNQNIDTLSGGQDQLAEGVSKVAGAVLGNDTLKNGVKDNFGNSAIQLLNAYKSAKGPLSTNMASLAGFETQMDSNPGIDGFLAKAQNLLAKTKAEGQNTYNAGVKKLNAGKKQYAQGLADYKAAPGKLAAGREALAEGLQKLMDGRQQLADGKDQLAQYEDGEQQVRDGLATLVGTEADLELESILDRLNGDGDFDNGDNHLELDEGLAAVDVGRGYQAEDGELITKEIMTRAIGTGGLLAAGVLAVLAAILSFMKKNKGAGVLAILSAVAGAFGAYEATQAGTYFSSIAGSTVGQSGMIAAGILAAVALVHSIAHFTAKKEA